MRTKLVGDGCSACNPELARDIAVDNAFDEWFDKNGFSEEHREMFDTVWVNAVAWSDRQEKS